MRILYHHRTQGRGAEGVHIREIVKALRKLGNEVTIVSPHGVDVLEDKCDHRFGGAKKTDPATAFLGWLSRNLPQVIFEIMEICYNVYSFGKISRLIKKEKVDAVYERYHFFGFSGAFLARRHGIPVILEVNELSGFERIREHFFVRLSKKIETYIFQKADAIIVVSKCLKQTIVNLGVPASKIHVMPNAVNAEEFDKDIKVSGEILNNVKIGDSVIIGFVGYLVKWHNLDFLIECFAEICKLHNNVRLLLVGDGPLKNELEQLLKKHGIDSLAVFTGNVKHSEIPQYIKLMDICIIPNSNEYRSPIKMFEYMAMSKVVLVPDTEPIRDIITDNINGVIFKQADKASFTARLDALIRSGDTRDRVGKEALRTILSKHLWEHNAKIILDMIRNTSRKEGSDGNNR